MTDREPRFAQPTPDREAARRIADKYIGRNGVASPSGNKSLSAKPTTCNEKTAVWIARFLVQLPASKTLGTPADGYKSRADVTRMLADLTGVDIAWLLAAARRDD